MWLFLLPLSCVVVVCVVCCVLCAGVVVSAAVVVCCVLCVLLKNILNRNTIEDSTKEIDEVGPVRQYNF